MNWRITKLEEGPSLGLRVTFVADNDPFHEYTGFFTKWSVRDMTQAPPHDSSGAAPRMEDAPHEP